MTGLIVWCRFVTVVLCRWVWSRTTSRVRTRSWVRGPRISSLFGSTWWVRFITTWRILIKINGGETQCNPIIHLERFHQITQQSSKLTSSDPLFEELCLCFCCWSCCFLSIADLCTARILGLDFQNCNQRVSGQWILKLLWNSKELVHSRIF